MVRSGEKYKKNKQTKPDFLDMVPWYSGYISVISLFIYLLSLLFNFKFFALTNTPLSSFFFGGGYVVQYIS